ncbi:MAG: PfkB family carbohydrate kinase [Actinomycetaceae bacterium]|nr:PfkB family carbohydrate kinase [Actinomycetaceae bacterium]
MRNIRQLSLEGLADQWGPVGRFISTQTIVVELPFSIAHLPERGGDVLGVTTGTTVGGGFSTVAAVARQGIETLLASPLGTGLNSAQSRTALAREGIATLGTEIVGDNGLRLTLLEPDGQRSTITSPGVEAECSPQELAKIDLRDGDWVFVSLPDLVYDTTGPALSSWVKTLPEEVKVAVGGGALVDEVPRDLLTVVLGRADLVSMNERETHIVVSRLGPGPVEHVMRKFIPPTCILVSRDGARGCTVQERAGAVPTGVRAFHVERVDTTGVGDTHIGVMVAGLIQGLGIEEAALRANVAAALALSKPGPGASPGIAQIDAFLK